MECEAARELYVEALAAGRPAPAEVEGHAESCGACRVELARLEAGLGGDGLAPAARGTGGRRPGDPPPDPVGSGSGGPDLDRRLAARRPGRGGGLRRLGFAVAARPVRGDGRVLPATRAAARAGAFLLAGLAYGLLPMLAAAALEHRSGGIARVIGGLEAVLVFFVVLVPYIVLCCGDFPVPLLAGFLAGIVLRAVFGEAASADLRRRMAFA
jgi:hypothetical protein